MNKNCISYWYPKLVEAGVPTPRTTIITTKLSFYDFLDKQGCSNDLRADFADFISELRAAADATGYPVFLRTGHGSGKHNWEHTCLIDDPKKNRQAVPTHYRNVESAKSCLAAWIRNGILKGVYTEKRDKKVLLFPVKHFVEPHPE